MSETGPTHDAEQAGEHAGHAARRRRRLSGSTDTSPS